MCSLQEVGHSEVHVPAAASRTTGSAHAASSYFTRFARLLTSYRRINESVKDSRYSETMPLVPR